MRILHTSDWHLGHTLRDQPREREHRAFLDWLIEVIGERAVDVLIVAGDVFDTANPPASAWRLWFDFLGKLRREHPRLQVVVIAGNHDSAARLEAPADVLRTLDVHVIGGLPRGPDGVVDVEPLLIPLRDAEGRPAALCVALPFLRPADLPAPPRATTALRRDEGAVLVPRPGEPDTGADPLVEGMRALHEAVFTAARDRLVPGQALIATAHCYMVGTEISELSERKVLGGNQHALPVDLFPEEVQFVALGHLHLPQEVGGREHVRYCGAPLPLSLAERHYPNQVCFVDLKDGRLQKVWRLRTPRTVAMLRIPERGEATPEEALAAIGELPDLEPGAEHELRPYLEIAVRLPRAVPDLQRRIEDALDGKAPRLTRLQVGTTGHGRSLPEVEPVPQLDALTPEQVFHRRWERDHEESIPAPLLAAFHDLVEEAGQEEA